MANALRRLNEGSADIVVTDNAEFERYSGCSGIAERRGQPGVRDWNHHIRSRRRFPGEFHSNVLAHFVNILAFDNRVRAGEIDIFENAEAPPPRGERVQ